MVTFVGLLVHTRAVTRVTQGRKYLLINFLLTFLTSDCIAKIIHYGAEF